MPKDPKSISEFQLCDTVFVSPRRNSIQFLLEQMVGAKGPSVGAESIEARLKEHALPSSLRQRRNLIYLPESFGRWHKSQTTIKIEEDFDHRDLMRSDVRNKERE